MQECRSWWTGICLPEKRKGEDHQADAILGMWEGVPGRRFFLSLRFSFLGLIRLPAWNMQ